VSARIVTVLLIALAVPALAGCGGALFFPSKKLEITPHEIGLVYEDVAFESEDGTALHGWFLPARYEGPEPSGTVIYFHGNAGNVANHLGGVYWLPSAGFQVFLFDYRGFGTSAGRTSLAGAHADALAAVRTVARRSDVDPQRIVAIGQSIGGAIALTTVANIRDEISIRGLVVDSAPSAFRGIAREKLNDFWLTWPLQYPLSWLVPSRPKPLEAATSLKDMPLLFVHGDRDVVVPLRHSLKLAEAAGNAELLIAPGVVHGQSFEDPTVRRRLIAFLNESLSSAASHERVALRAP
jgi:fermentation-respiration switch protein FrsA (DUF1100 family)